MARYTQRMGTGLVCGGLMACAFALAGCGAADEMPNAGVARGDAGSDVGAGDAGTQTDDDDASASVDANARDSGVTTDDAGDAPDVGAADAGASDSGPADSGSSVDASADSSSQDAARDAAADSAPSFPCSDNGRFTVSSTTALDSTTGLTWERAASALINHSQATTRCAGLGQGWHVPTAVQLRSIVRVEAGCSQAIDAYAFPSTPKAKTNQADDSFWTDTISTAPAVPANSYITVHFAEGTESTAAWSATLRTKCVR